jgi:carboxyl-terminal processing protease
LRGKGPGGIIIDLRSNPGGLLNAVLEVASYFLKDGTVVRVRDNGGPDTVDCVQ